MHLLLQKLAALALVFLALAARGMPLDDPPRFLMLLAAMVLLLAGDLRQDWRRWGGGRLWSCWGSAPPA